jgi:hypothetical protein
MRGTLTALFKMDSEKGAEIGRGFTYLCHEFNQFLELPDQQKGQIIAPILALMKKLGKVAEAIDRYESLEEVKMEALVTRATNDKSSVHLTHQDRSVELEGDVEEVINSSKAALDAAVKILIPLWGINLPTYRNAGQNVASALRRNVPTASQPRVEKLIELIEASEPWIRELRDQRTDAEHQGNSIVSPMAVTIENGQPIKQYPKVGDMLAKEYINKIYDDIFCFLQDFIMLALTSRVYSGLIPVVANGEVGKKRKFGLTINITQPTN